MTYLAAILALVAMILIAVKKNRNSMKFIKRIIAYITLRWHIKSVIAIADPITLKDIDKWLERNKQFVRVSSDEQCATYQNAFVEVRVMKSGYVQIGTINGIGNHYIASPMDKKEIELWIKYFSAI